MSLFLHPHLTRGIVHTPMGSFTVHRGMVELPEDAGRALGWAPVDADAEWLVNADGPEAGRVMAGESAPSATRVQQSR
jgi:hypothetical protein